MSTDSMSTSSCRLWNEARLCAPCMSQQQTRSIECGVHADSGKRAEGSVLAGTCLVSTAWLANLREQAAAHGRTSGQAACEAASKAAAAPSPAGAEVPAGGANPDRLAVPAA